MEKITKIEIGCCMATAVIIISLILFGWQDIITAIMLSESTRALFGLMGYMISLGMIVGILHFVRMDEMDERIEKLEISTTTRYSKMD